MKITSTYLENLSFTQENGSKDALGGVNGSFQNVMDKSIDNIADKPKPKPKAEFKTEPDKKFALVRNTADNNAVKQTPANAEPTPAVNKNDDRIITALAPVNETAAKQAETDAPMAMETINADIAVQIAAVLSVPLEIVINLLNDLGFEAIDLADKPKLHLFIQQLYDAGNPAELLNIPDINETFADVEAILARQTPDNPQNPAHSAVIVNEWAVYARPDIPAETAHYAPPPAAQPVTVTTRPLAAETALPNEAAILADAPAAEPVAIKIAPAQTPGDISAQTQPRDGFIPATEREIIIQAEDGEVIAAAPQTPARAVTFTPQQARAPVAPREVINQIADRIRVEVRGNITELRMLLRPESLGEVSLKIATVNGIVTAQFIAENQRVRQVIEANFAELRDALAERGVEVGELSVSVGGDATNEAMESFLRESGRTAERAGRPVNAINVLETAAILTEITEDIYGATVSYTA